ncbi:MAG: hypothetical protein QOH21_3371 [Acidobacteriota bacterium]|jgi:hypothetical protein|nr:hypothetical protein [Acidobacteriota bacterium]
MRSRVLSFLLVITTFIAVSAHAQWLPDGATTGDIHYDNGKVGIGTGASTPGAQLHVVSTSALAQMTLGKSGTTGVISAYVNSPDSGSIAFDSTYVGGWYAQHSSAGFISKVSGKMIFQGASGLTAGTAIPGASFIEHMSLNLATGKLGIGTSIPVFRLDVQYPSDVNFFPGTPMTMQVIDKNAYNTANTGAGIAFTARYNAAGANTQIGAVAAIKESIVDGNYAGALTFGTRTHGSLIASMERMRITSTGDVGIGTTAPTAKLDVNGNLKVSGNVNVTGTITGASVIGAVYQDLAEWVPATEDMLPGTVVVLDPAVSNQVMPSHRAYDLTVAGVVSAQPGLILGVGSATKEQIATTGRVKVKVDATRGAIAIGDILVTSDKPGMAMKSQPIDVAGIAIHRPGTVVGKALEPLANSEGEILVLLSLQ